MKRAALIFGFLLCVAVSGAVGYWFGFREGMWFGGAADALPKGVLATGYLNSLRAGKPDNVMTALEFDVDNGLIWGHELFQHPLRRVVAPLWGFDVYPEYEKYAVRLANYRKGHPSLMRAEAFDTVPPDKEQYRDFYREIAQGTRENIARMNAMIERYATKP